MIIQFEWPIEVPLSEFSREFIQGMMNRMATAYYRYGKVSDGFPNKVNALASAELRIKKYIETGNLEYLMDGANFLMIESMQPSFDVSKCSVESPGRVWHGEIDPIRDRNIPDKRGD